MKFNLLKSVFGLFLIAAISGSAHAQRLSGGARINTERCKSGILHKQLMLTDPQYAAQIQANEAKIQQIISSGGDRSGSTYVIPVVVHVLHKGEAVGTATNISDAQINSAIANMNDCYSGTGSYPTNVDVQFQLAQRDPNCNSTTGIVRVNASAVADYNTNGITTSNEQTIKAISKWPNSEYYNIWIVSEIDNNGGGSGTQGYAYFPGAGSDVDGAVILYNSFGYDPNGTIGYNLKTYTRHNVTANHELGHAFNLYHTFEGDDANDDGTADQCPANVTCTSDGDLCCDTEAHRRDDGDCGSTGSSCTGQSLTNVVQNIMSYSSDACQVQFTADQTTRMRAAISGSRGTLLTSPGLLAVTGSSPSVAKACSPQSTNLSNNAGMGVYGLTIGSTTYSSSGTVADGGFRNNWCSNFNLTPNTLYSITVTNGTLNNEKVRVYIDYNNDGDFEDTGESVYNHTTGALTHTGSFTTAASPVTGQPLWIRVISDFVNYTINSSCFVPTYGQVEDFSVTFTGGCTPPTITGTTPGSRCGTGTVVLGATASAGTLNWYTASSGGSSLGTGTSFTTPSISSTTTYYVDATNGGCTSARTAVVATVNTTPTVTSTTPSSRCGTGIVVLGATASAGTLNWFAASSGGSSLGTGTSFTTPSISSTTTYYVDATNGGCTSARTAVAATVNATVTPSVSVSITAGSNPSCAGTAITFTAIPTNGGSSPSYQWMVNGSNAGTNNSVFSTSSLTNSDVVNCLLTSNETCVSSSTATSNNISITINALPTVTANASSSSVCSGTSVTLSGGGATSYSWSHGVSDGVAFVPASTQTYTVTGTTNGCSNVTQITVNVNACGGTGTTKLNAVSCGATGLSIASTIYCDPVAGATDYEFTITNTSLGYSQVKYRGTGTPNAYLGAFPGLAYGQTYDVAVKAKVGGLWGPAGTICQITLRSFPATQLNSASCGATELSLSSTIYCVAVPGATDYEFTVTNSGLGYSQVKYRGSGTANAYLMAFPGLAYGQTYDVAVKAKVAGVWGPNGAVCSITLMSFPTTQLNSSSCGATGLSTTSVIYCTAVAGATDYEYTVTNSSLGYSQIRYRGNNSTNAYLSAFPGLVNGQTYDVTVKAKAAGVWGPVGPVCQITLAPSALANNEQLYKESETISFKGNDSSDDLNLELNAYPNPSDGNGFDVAIDGLESPSDILLTIFDIYGKSVYSERFAGQSNGPIVKLNTDGSFSKGIYIVNVQVEGKAINQKIIIQ